MTAPLSSFSGVASGFNYSTLVDAIIQQESAPLTAMQTRKAALASRDQALATYSGMLSTLQLASRRLGDGSALEASAATIGLVSGTNIVASVSTTGSVESGSHLLQVTQLAQAQKLGGTTNASATAALGLAGTFTINGASLALTTDDTLTSVRDKLNALNTGTTPSGVSASILSVSPTDQRLVLTSAKSGSAGITLADTTGTALQSLGLLNAGETIPASAVLVAGRDAQFKLDTIDFVRSTNVVNDAVPGLTLTLTKADATSTNQVVVAGDVASASNAVQSFATAYNALVGFLKQQQTTAADGTSPPLFNNSLIRSARSALPTQLLQPVAGAASDLNTAASVGLELQADGTVSYTAATFTTAFQNRFADVEQLFKEKLAASDPEVGFITGGTGNSSGSWAVNITAPATKASIVTTGFNGTYDAGVTPDTLNVTDDGNGHTAHVALTTGMTTSDIVTALQTAFTASGLNLTASANGNDITLMHGNFGSHAGITVLVTGGGDGASEAWTQPSTVYGTDVTGTIGGAAATGSGQVLVGNTGTSAAGVSARYSGTTARAAGTVTMQLGVGAMVQRTLDGFLTTGTGWIDQATTLDANQSSALDTRMSAMQERLTLRRTSLMATFAKMETAISAIQSQSAALFGTTSAVSSTTAANSTKAK